MADEFAGEPVNVDALEVVELLSFEVEDSLTTDDRDMSAAAIEDVPVHKMSIYPSPSVDQLLPREIPQVP